MFEPPGRSALTGCPPAAGTTASGVIGYTDTADVFKVAAGAGSLSVQVGATAGSNCHHHRLRTLQLQSGHRATPLSMQRELST